MPRSGVTPKHVLIPDPIYGSTLVTRFINGLLWKGKRETAERIFYNCMGILESKTGEDALTVFKRAINNIKPTLEVKSRRVGGATYQVPVEVRPERKVALAIRWVIGFSRARKEHTMEERLAMELLDAAKGIGNAVKKRDDTHKMAEANKAFAHYRW
jgi:small subunit ribosomal protein S7